MAYPRAELDSLGDGNVAVDDKGVTWWRLEVGTGSGQAATGWVCGGKQTDGSGSHPSTNWESPWAWPGFEIVDATTINIADAFKRNLSVTGSANPKEQKAFAPSTEAVGNSALLSKLEQTVSRLPSSSGTKDASGKDGSVIVTAVKLRQALARRWLAGELGHVILKYESEWGGGTSRWEALTPLMRSAAENWKCELERIKKLQWWDSVKGKVDGFPSSPVVSHIHPVAMVGNFVRSAGVNSISENGLYFIFSHEAMAGTTNRLHWPGGASGVTLGAGYDMKARSASSIASDMKSIGLPDTTAQAISNGAGLQGSAARTFASANHNLVNLSDDQQVQLLRHTVPFYENMVRKSIKVPLSQNQFDALVSFAYNPAARWQSVTNFINNGHVDSAMAKIREGNTSGGVVMAGLTNRRSDEVNLYLSNRYEFNGQTLPQR
ncbi:glycoside hydrolase family protein [Burkholderia sp. LMG 32019]|uniref:glycoside hydrolase family protein n=1 Tax=Burkholderia sp. LMG 32019 TaxID=3158173 RepID=UPI003C2B7E3A